MTSIWVLFFSCDSDARSNKHQILGEVLHVHVRWTKDHFFACINLLTPELFFLGHPVYKMLILQESNTLEL